MFEIFIAGLDLSGFHSFVPTKSFCSAPRFWFTPFCVVLLFCPSLPVDLMARAAQFPGAVSPLLSLKALAKAYACSTLSLIPV